jgi:hypothetical protein
MTNYVCGAFLGVSEAFCNFVAMRTFRRVSEGAVILSEVGDWNLPQHLMGFHSSDWGPGFNGPSYGWPIMFGSL